MESAQVIDEPFPAECKRATGQIDGISTEATVLLFADRILVTLCQEGRLSQWVCKLPKGIDRQTAFLTTSPRFKYPYLHHPQQP